MGDVVLARHPRRRSLKLVKRVAAVPGDRITVQGDEWRVEEGANPDVPFAAEGAAAGQVWALGEDEYFLVGEAPDLSTDARHFGPISRRDILGRAWVVYWPLSRRRVVEQGNRHQATGNRA
jgi:signal peptidase I